MVFVHEKAKIKVQVNKCNLVRGVKAKRRKTRTGIVYSAQVLPMTAGIIAYPYSVPFFLGVTEGYTYP
jgi:hypothetical protein